MDADGSMKVEAVVHKVQREAVEAPEHMDLEEVEDMMVVDDWAVERIE